MARGRRSSRSRSRSSGSSRRGGRASAKRQSTARRVASRRRSRQREERANVREQARSAPQRAAQRAAKARAAAPSYLAGLQAAGGLSGTQGAGAGQANRLANEYGQKGTTDARKREIAKELKGVRRQLNVDNRKRAYNSLNLGKTNKGLVMRTSDGSIIRDSSGNPILSSAGKDAFDQTRQGYSDRSEYLRQTNPELYNKMYPVAGAAMNILPKAMQAIIPGGSIIKGIGSALKGGADKVKSGIGSIFDKFQNDQGATSGQINNFEQDLITESGGGQGSGSQTPESGFSQSEATWSGIYGKLIGQGMTPEQAKQRMAEMGQSGGMQTFGPIPQQFRIQGDVLFQAPQNVLKPSEGVVGGIPGAGGMFTRKIANTPANAITAFNQTQPMSTQQLSFAPQQPLNQAPQGLGQFSSMLNKFS